MHETLRRTAEKLMLGLLHAVSTGHQAISSTFLYKVTDLGDWAARNYQHLMGNLIA